MRGSLFLDVIKDIAMRIVILRELGEYCSCCSSFLGFVGDCLGLEIAEGCRSLEWSGVL